MDWLVAFRNHPVEWATLQAASLLPLYALGYSAEAIGLYAVTYAAQSLLNHANIRLPLGPLRHVIVGPEFHHWHHANQPEAFDRNFAAQLALWDRLFGTLHLPAGRRPAAFGTNERLPRGLLGMLAYPFRRKAAPPQALRRAFSGS
jgi:sterol desaturase/sphingolipid hydroxylase (fatty acid hydroxylase superfamily)